MKCMLACSVLLLLVIPASGQPESVTVKEGRFSVRFPGRPKENTQSTKTDAGTVKLYTATYALPDGSIFISSSAEFPSDVVKAEFRDKLFDGVIKGLTGKDGTEVSRKDIEIGKDKEKGREVLIDKGKQQTRYRIVVKDGRLIQVGVVGAGDFIKSKDAAAFLDSLEFTK